MKAARIRFTGEMVRAILDGRKTQTRRLVTAANSLVDGEPNASLFARLALPSAVVDPGPSPAGNPGPYLKAFLVGGDTRHRIYPRYGIGQRLWVREAWWASRLTLEITDVRVERVKDISEDGILADINGDGALEVNSWVWVVEFKKVGS